MSDRDPALVPVALGEIADQADVHLVGARADVEVDVDVAVVLAPELEDAPDLPGPIRVVRGRSADHRGAALQRRHHVAVGLGGVGPALLGEDAQLQVDGPGVVGRELAQGLEAAQPDVGVDLHVRAHVGDAVENAPLQRLGGPCVHVLHREPGLDRGYALHVVAGTARGRGAALDDARLVEVDVGLDETGGDQAAVEIEGVGRGSDLRLDCRDSAAGDPDIHWRSIGVRARDPGSAQHEVQGHEPLLCAGANRPALAASVVDVYAPRLPVPPVPAGLPEPASARGHPEAVTNARLSAEPVRAAASSERPWPAACRRGRCRATDPRA